MSKLSTVLLTLILLINCREPLIESSYATVGEKSVNGVEIFRMLLEEFGEVNEVSYVTKKDFEKSDLIVHFEKFPDVNLYSEIDKALLGENYWIEMPYSELSREKQNQPTVLYFYRTTDTDYWFWSRVKDDMPEGSRARQWTELVLAFYADIRPSRIARSRIRSTMAVDNETVYNRINYTEMKPGPARLPVQGHLNFEDGYPPINKFATTILGTFIANARYGHCNLVTVSSAEPFLDYHMVRPEMRKLARNVIRQALAIQMPTMYEPTSEKKVITVVTGSMRPVWQQAEQERKFWQILTVAPWNVVLGLFLMGMLLAIWMRSGYSSPPEEAPELGSRRFVEHFEALGRRLEKSGLSTFESYERLKARQRGRIND